MGSVGSDTGVDRLSAEETRKMVARAAEEMGGLVRTTFGPFGRDKMVVRRMQNEDLRTFVSNDGIAILEEFEGETGHPIANQFIDLAEDHEEEYGDGSTATVVYASELLRTGVDLLERGLAPTDVVEGFSIGGQRTLEIWDEQSIPLASTPRPTTPREFDGKRLSALAWSGMTNGRSGDWPLEGIVDDVVEATFRAWEPDHGTVSLSFVRTEAVAGGDVGSTELLSGILLPYEPMRGEYLPAEGRILLVDGDLKPRGIRSGSVSVSLDEATVAAGLERETTGIADAIAAADIGAVFVAGDVTHEVAVALSRYGIPCLRNVKDAHLRLLARVTGSGIRATVGPSVPPSADDLGTATVEAYPTPDRTWLAVTADGRPGCLQLVVRGGTETAADEAERRVKGGLNAVRAGIKRPAALSGGGAIDLEASQAVTALAPRFDGREQLAVEGFADVLEVIPRTLARNAGHDPIDALADLRTRHDTGGERAGIDAAGRLVDDTVAASGALDAFAIRASGLVRAIEFANSILTIDSVLIDNRPPDIDWL